MLCLLLKCPGLERGLSPKDLVVLRAAHTIGTTACFFMTERLYKFSGLSSDPTAFSPLLYPEGYDASILIDGLNAEKKGFGHAGIRGFDVIESAKTILECKCPGVVSCANIIALAARDAVVLSNGPFYQVPTGRRDGLSSDALLASEMPEVGVSVSSFKKKFAERGLSPKDLVVLSGAHTIGTPRVSL